MKYIRWLLFLAGCWIVILAMIGFENVHWNYMLPAIILTIPLGLLAMVFDIDYKKQ